MAATDMRGPCNNCPFRFDVRPFMNPERVEEIVDQMEKDQHFLCHKTVHSLGGDRSKEERMCGGSMIFQEKIERPNQLMRLAERLGLYDRTRLNMDAPVYGDGEAMIEAAYRAKDGSWINPKGGSSG